MSGGGSKSSSKSNTTTSTSSTTQQQDQRVAATDAGIAIGPNTTGTINISQLPPETGTILQGFLDLTQMALETAAGAGQVAVDTQTQLNETQSSTAQNNQRLIWVGLAVLAAVYVFKGEF